MKSRLSFACLIILTLTTMVYGQSDSDNRPNFLVIVADDMGFSDLATFGGEIPSPGCDRLAHDGVKYTNFYSSTVCSPTRAMLLSGVDNHLNGLGSFYSKRAPNQMGVPGYEGVLNFQVAALPAILKENGYHTYMAGKWHLGKDPEHIPRARGFERDFSMLDGAGSHFTKDAYHQDLNENQYTEDGEYLKKLPDNYYATKTYTDKLIDYIDSNRGDGKPFFAYLAHQAPHDPIQVPDDWLRRHKGRYDIGWDSLRTERLSRMIEMGIFPQGTKMSPRLWFVPKWDDLTPFAQKMVARKMEVYASLVEYMDMQIARVIDYLEEIGELDNTYILLFSDNGPENIDHASSLKGKQASMEANWFAQTYRTDFESWGRSNSYVALGVTWAQACATPFYLFKMCTYEGGIRSPLIVKTPKNINSGKINHQAILYVMDVAPTILDIAGIKQPTKFKGQDVLPMQGKSWANMLKANAESPRNSSEWIAMEHWGARAVRKGDWKITWMHAPLGMDEWELFNLKNDPAEQINLAKANPEKLSELLAHWDQYTKENNVILPNKTVFDGLEDILPPRPPVSGDFPGSEPNYGEDKDSDDE